LFAALLPINQMRRIFTLLLIIFSPALFAQKFKDLALTPPVGWNSWNKFACDGISEKAIRDVADAMALSGMKDAGYRTL
jgi:alpha-galactosidase